MNGIAVVVGFSKLRTLLATPATPAITGIKFTARGCSVVVVVGAVVVGVVVVVQGTLGRLVEDCWGG